MKKVLIDLLKEKIDPKVKKVRELKQKIDAGDNKQEEEETREQLKSAEHELKTGVNELNKLVINGDSGFIFQWTKKLDLFAPDGTCELIHYLAQSDILQLVLPSMLDNAKKIVDREVGGIHGENIENSKRFILEQVSKQDKGGLPAIQRALVGNSLDSFKYLLNLENCKKGIFDVGSDGSNIFHQAILRGAFQELIPYIEGEKLNRLALDEGVSQQDIAGRIQSMLISKNGKGYSPAKLSAYVASAPDFRYIFKSDALKTESGNTEKRIVTTKGDRILSETVAHDKDKSLAKEVGLTEKDELIDYLFIGLQDLSDFIINLVDNQSEEIFDAILKRQKITKEYGLGKYVISIIHHIRDLDNSKETEASKLETIMAIYRKIFAEYWPEITINDNNLKAYEQLQIIAKTMDSVNDSVMQIPVEQLKEALDITEEELKQCDGDVVAAAKNKIFGNIAKDYESDHQRKTVIKHQIKLGDSSIIPPSPVKINVKKVVSSVVNKKVIKEDSPIIQELDKLVKKVESVVEPKNEDKLEATTDLKVKDVDFLSPVDEAPKVEHVKIGIKQHVEHIFDHFMSQKELEGNDGLKGLYDDLTNENCAEQDIDKADLILRLARGMSGDPGMFLDFVNESVSQKNGKTVSTEAFITEFIDHVGIDALSDFGCVNFEDELAKIIIQRLHEVGKLTPDHLEYAMEEDNASVIDIAMSTGSIRYQDALEVAFQQGNVAFLERCLKDNRFSNDSDRVSEGFLKTVLKGLIQSTESHGETNDDEAMLLDLMNKQIAYITVILNNRQIISKEGIFINSDFVTALNIDFDNFENDRLFPSNDYQQVKNDLKNIEGLLKENPLANPDLSDTPQSNELSVIGSLTDNFESMTLDVS